MQTLRADFYARSVSSITPMRAREFENRAHFFSERGQESLVRAGAL